MEKDNKFGLRVVNMNMSVDAPIIKTIHSKEWVMWGEQNTFPQYLLDLYHNRSITHKQIINRKVKMIAGNGIEQPLNPSKEYIEFFNNINGGMNMDQMAMKISFDIVIFNGISLNPHWNVDNTSLTRLCYIPFDRARQDKNNKLNEDDGLPDYIWLSNNWCKIRDNEPEKYVTFNQKWENDKSQIYYFTNIDQGIKFYPDVEYSPALNYIEAAWEIGNYHNSAIKNGFHAGFILNFGTGIPTEEEMDRAYENITEQFVGSSKANKFILAWSNGKDGAPTLLPIPTNNTDTKFLELNNLIRDNIFEAHEVVSPSIFGIQTPGKLGSRDELIEALSIYQSSYIDGKQKIIEDILNKFAALSGVDIEKEPIKLKKYKLDIPEPKVRPTLTMGDIISIINTVKTNQLDMNSAINILDIIYGIDIEDAKKILRSNIDIQPQNKTTI